jgi:hypothetical protein
MAFALGVVVGSAIAIGDRPASRVAGPTVLSTVTSEPSGSGVDWGNTRCSSVSGTRLKMGMQVVNHSADQVMLTGVTVAVPPNGLLVRSTGWTYCADDVTTADTLVLAPGASAWVSVTTDTLIPCPANLSVTFVVSYRRGDRALTLGPTNYAGLPEAYPSCD